MGGVLTMRDYEGMGYETVVVECFCQDTYTLIRGV